MGIEVDLPRPDEYGNYWLGAKPGKLPAIFPSKKIVNKEVTFLGKWYVMKEDGMLLDQRGHIALFRHPLFALRGLNGEA